MIFRSTSIQSVIARVIRNTRVQDASYLIDMMEWIPEAMGQMQTKEQLHNTFEDVAINFHKGKLPCDLVDLFAVEYNGARLPYRNSVKNIKTGHNITDTVEDTPSLFTTVIATQNQAEFTSEQNHIWGTTLTQTGTPITKCDIHPSAYYQTEMEYINTSFADGVVRLHYQARPVDAQGLPLIPDNENYKEALYCYSRAKMIGCGYQDSTYTEKELMQRFELYATRAVNEIIYPSPDIMDSRILSMVRFIPPANYWENFFRTDSPERIYN